MRALILLPVFLLLATPVFAQGKKSADYFPTDIGCTWTYRLLLEANGKKKEIKYTTKVEKKETLKDIGPCMVFVSRSGDRLLKEAWYSLEGGKLAHHREKGYRAKGKTHTTQTFTKRWLLTDAELTTYKGEESKTEPRTWTCSDGSEGSLQLTKTERVYLSKIGDLKGCLVVVDQGSYYKGKGKDKKLVRKSILTLWLAPGLGIVKEELLLSKPDGTTLFHTVAALIKYQEP